MKKFLFLALISIFFMAAPSQAQSYFKQGALIEGTTTSVTAAGTTILVSTSLTNEVFTGTSTQTVQLLNAQSTVPGRSFYIVNKSTGAVTVKLNDGTTALGTIPAPSAGSDSTAIVKLISNATTNGTWSLALNGGSSSGGTFLPLSGGTMTGNIAMSGSALILVGTGVSTGSLLQAGLSHEILNSGIPTSNLIGITSNVQQQISQVNLVYENDAGTSITGGTDTLIPFTTKNFDNTSGAWSTDTFTAPVTAKYFVGSFITFSTTNLSLAQVFEGNIYKNGSFVTGLWSTTGTGNGLNYRGGGFYIIALNAGDTVQIKVNSPVTTSLLIQAGYSRIEIFRIGL